MAMRSDVADRYLRRFVVQITDVRDRPLGSGVLVGPGLVLTCAHVVTDNTTVRVRLDPAGLLGPGPSRVDACVRARSALRDMDATTVFWPPPDLALVGFDDPIDHVFAPLEVREPSRLTELHAWGFGLRENGVAPVGSPASFTFVGEDGDGFLQLKAGDATSGLSGAPLVCPTLRGVVGVMSVSRDPSDARGGWASPVAALTGDGHVVGEELRNLMAKVLEQNRAGVWRHRDVWNRALPVVDAVQSIEQPWLVRDDVANLSAPSSMLRAEFGVVDYLFREQQLAAARRWCDGQSPFAISFLEAVGGAGKTRFALELCRIMTDQGWVAGFLPRKDRGISTAPVARLLAVDYFEEAAAAALADEVAALARSATVMSPVRILLLGRPRRGSTAAPIDVLQTQPAIDGIAMMALDQALDVGAAAADLTLEQRRQLYEVAVPAFGQQWHGPAWLPPRDIGVDLRVDRLHKPLDVLFEALDVALSNTSGAPSNRPPVDRALDHERRHWVRQVSGIPARVVDRAVALATLAGARSEEEARALLALIPQLGRNDAASIDNWLQSLYDGPDRWNPLRPDRLGETLISQVVRSEPDGGRELLDAVISLPSDAQLERSIDVFTRLTTDARLREVLTTTMVAHHEDLVRRCAPMTTTDRAPSLRTALLSALVRLHLTVLGDEFISGLPLPDQTMLSRSMDRLGDLAGDYGLPEQAARIYRSAQIIDERRVALDPGNTWYRRDLSISYNKLGDLAIAQGRTAEARDLYRKVLDMRRELTELDPTDTEYRRDLSISYNKLGDLAVAQGRSAEARDLYQLGLDIRRELSMSEPGNTEYRRDLSISYTRFGELAQLEGRIAEARDFYELGLVIRRELADSDPTDTGYRRDLSISYSRLGELAQLEGRIAEARDFYELGLGIRRELADLDPTNTEYRRDLSISYSRLGELAQLEGRISEAQDLYQKVLDIRRELTELDPTNTEYRRDLSIAFRRLGELAQSQARIADARILYEQGRDIIRELTQVAPDNADYRDDLDWFDAAISHLSTGDD